MPQAIYTPTSIRQLEKDSIRAFMEKYQMYLRGTVLDYGAGREPYRDLVMGNYVPYDLGSRWPDGYTFDTIMCNQVVQYIADVPALFASFASGRFLRKPGGHLVMTYPTNWDLVEEEDLWRFTPFGMSLLLRKAGFTVIHHERRADVNLNGFRFPLGFGVVAKLS